MAAIDLPSETPERRIVTARHWAALAIAAVAACAGLAALTLGLTASSATALVRQNAIGTIATFALDMTIVVVGLILRRNRPDHPLGWLFLLFGAAVGLSSLVWAGTYVTGLPGGDRELGGRIAWLGAILTLPSWTFLVTSMIIRFPSGYPESAGEARLLKIAGPVCLAAGAFAAVRPGPFFAYPGYSNPLALPADLVTPLTIASAIAIVAPLVPGVLGLWFMAGRYRRASATGRLQLRWFAFAVALTFFFGWLFVVLDLGVARTNQLRELSYAVFILAACSLPIAVLQAIMRHRLYDIDTIIGRTVAYGALTAILAGLYSASVRLFNALFVALTGQESEAALVLTTLVLATTFTPIKTYLERLAARRFPATPNAEAAAQPDPDVTASHEDLDARIEAIARRVALEVLADRAGDTRER